MAGAQTNAIKSRIKSVSGTMQITKAMELVATSKLRAAKERAEGSRPYSEVLRDSIGYVASAASIDGAPWIGEADPEKPTLYIVIAGDRGLAGGYNSNIFKLTESLDPGKDGIYLPVGKKACDYVRKRGRQVFDITLQTVDGTGVSDCLRAAERVAEEYFNGSFGRVVIVYTKFVSMLTQTAVSEQVLPLVPKEGITADPILEDDAEQMLADIVPQYIGGVLNASVKESLASECGARRTAMNSANKNAEEMIDSLMLKFNRARQAVITQEITEIVSGAEAL